MKHFTLFYICAAMLTAAACHSDPASPTVIHQTQRATIASIKEQYTLNNTDDIHEITAQTEGDTIIICGIVTATSLQRLSFMDDGTAALAILADNQDVRSGDSIELDVTGLHIGLRNGETMCGKASYRTDRGHAVIATIDPQELSRRIRHKSTASLPSPITITIEELASAVSPALMEHRLAKINDVFTQDGSAIYDSAGRPLPSSTVEGLAKPSGRADVTGILRHDINGWSILITGYTLLDTQVPGNRPEPPYQAETKMFPAYNLTDGMKCCLYSDSKIATPPHSSDTATYLYAEDCPMGNDGSIEPDENSIFTLSSHGRLWTITLPSGQLLCAVEGSAAVSATSALSDIALWDITIEADGTATIVNAHTASTLQYIEAYCAFGCFSDPSAGLSPIIYTSK